MDYAAIVEASITAIESGDLNRLDDYVSDDLIFHGVLLGDLNKPDFVKMMKALADAMPDWSFNHMITLITETQVLVSIQVTATHTNDLYLPFPGMPAIEATNKFIRMPREMLRFILNGDRISEIYVEPVEGGDLAGLLARLGVEVPSSDSL